jgi:hypothetical protein
MTAIAFRLAAGLLLTLLLPLAVIRASSHEDRALLRLLNAPSGCDAPCFMGLRPGTTPLEDALAILAVHEWVDEVRPYLSGTAGRIHFTWSDQRPAYINPRFTGKVHVFDNNVDIIEITTAVPYGTVWLMLGKPTLGAVGIPDETTVHLLEMDTSHSTRQFASLLPFVFDSHQPRPWFNQTRVWFISDRLVRFRYRVSPCDLDLPYPIENCD